MNNADEETALARARQVACLVFLAEPERAGKDYTPGDIACKLERSAGAVSNCLDKLADAGVAEQTSDKPRRFRLSAAAAEGCRRLSGVFSGPGWCPEPGCRLPAARCAAT